MTPSCAVWGIAGTQYWSCWEHVPLLLEAHIRWRPHTNISTRWNSDPLHLVQGAANVRCSQCQYVTPVAAQPPTAPASAAPPVSGPPSGPSQEQQQQGQAPRAQLQCAGCQIMLMYPRGAANVQCAVCGVVSSAAQVCASFNFLLMSGCCNIYCRCHIFLLVVDIRVRASASCYMQAQNCFVMCRQIQWHTCSA